MVENVNEHELVVYIPQKKGGRHFTLRLFSLWGKMYQYHNTTIIVVLSDF
jgi:hypothetical protein